MAAAGAVEADDAPWGLEGFGGGGTTGVVGVFNSRSWAGTGMLINSLLGGANGLSTSVLTSDSSLLVSNTGLGVLMSDIAFAVKKNPVFQHLSHFYYQTVILYFRSHFIYIDL